jgi:hypothetical protein
MAHVGIALRQDLDLAPAGPAESIQANVGDALPEFDDERYPMLRLVDPYGDTIFSTYQMVGLIAELEARFAETGDSSLAQAIVAAEHCKARVGTWLVFIGD